MYRYNWEPGPVEQAVERFLFQHLCPSRKERAVFRYDFVKINFENLEELERQINGYVKDGNWEVVQLFAFLPSDAITRGAGEVVVLFKVRRSGIVKA